MKEGKERVAITFLKVFRNLRPGAIFPMCHTDSYTGGLFCSSYREASMFP
jgi:hypothetical protein